LPRAKEREVHTIYLVENTITGKIYIGKTGLNGQRRLYKHKGNAIKRNLPGLLYNSMRKHGVDNFTVRELGHTSKQFINMLEKLYILIYDSQNKDVGYNMTAGGDGGAIGVGRKLSEARKIAVGNSSRGRKWSPEQREVLMAARKKQADENRGKPRPEMQGRVGPMKGKKQKPESIAKQLATRRALGQIGEVTKPPAKYKRIVRDEAWYALQPIRREAARQRQLEYMATKPHSEEARLKMQEASKKYWAEQKAKGGPLSNTARTQSTGDVVHGSEEEGRSSVECSPEPFAVSA
jgi:group I intron endonuclease